MKLEPQSGGSPLDQPTEARSLASGSGQGHSSRQVTLQLLSPRESSLLPLTQPEQKLNESLDACLEALGESAQASRLQSDFAARCASTSLD